jgi:hypothetical protein
MANNVTLEPLMENMRVKLQAFNNEGVEITNETIHNSVLADDDGFRPSQSSSKLYKGAILWTIWANGGKNAKWPTNWMEQSVQELAENLMSKQPTE